MASAEGMAMSEGRNPGYREQQDGGFKHFKWLKALSSVAQELIQLTWPPKEE